MNKRKQKFLKLLKENKDIQVFLGVAAICGVKVYELSSEKTIVREKSFLEILAEILENFPRLSKVKQKELIHILEKVKE